MVTVRFEDEFAQSVYAQAVPGLLHSALQPYVSNWGNDNTHKMPRAPFQEMVVTITGFGLKEITDLLQQRSLALPEGQMLAPEDIHKAVAKSSLLAALKKLRFSQLEHVDFAHSNGQYHLEELTLTVLADQVERVRDTVVTHAPDPSS